MESMTNLDIEVGATVNSMMFRRRMTQTAMCKRLGISQTSLSKKLHGERKWTLRDLYAVAAALNCEVADLLPSWRDTDQYHARFSVA